MAYKYNEVRLEKGLYSEAGKSFEQALETLDPNENYRGTPYENMDAFQRQLKRFDIRVRGAGSDAGEKSVLAAQAAARTLLTRVFPGNAPAAPKSESGGENAAPGSAAAAARDEETRGAAAERSLRRDERAVGARGLEMSRVSDYFRRDSRRYDSGFEKY